MDNSPKKKEEALCDYLLCEYLENPPQPQNWNESEEAPPPDDIFLSRIDRELAQQTKRKMGTPRKYLQPAAAVVLVLLLALSVTAVAQNWNIYNFLVSYSKHGVSVSNGEVESEPAIYVDYSNTYVPSYVPKGYNIGSRADGNGIVSLLWQNKSGDKIRLDQYQIKNQLELSKEAADTMTEIQIQGQKGILIQEGKTGKLTLMWGTNPQFVLSGVISKEEAIKMAESVGYCE